MRKVVKSFLIAVTVILFCIQAHAQIQVGAKFGANLNQFNYPGTTIGFNGGAFARYPVMDFVSVRAELLYSQQGGARSDYSRDYAGAGVDGNVSSVNYTHRYVNLNNLEIPVMAELGLPDLTGDNIIKPRLLLGISYAFNLAAVEHQDRTYFFSSGPVTEATFSNDKENVRSNYAHSQWGAVVGFGIDFPVGERTLTMEVRYKKGLNNLNLNQFANIPNISPQQHERLIASSLSINFALTLFNF